MSWSISATSPLIGAVDDDGNETDFLIRLIESQDSFGQGSGSASQQVMELLERVLAVYLETGEVRISESATKEERKFLRLWTQGLSVPVSQELTDAMAVSFKEEFFGEDLEDLSQEDILERWKILDRPTRALFADYMRAVEKQTKSGEWISISESPEARDGLFDLITSILDTTVFQRLALEAAGNEEERDELAEFELEGLFADLESAYKVAKKNAEEQGEPSSELQSQPKKKKKSTGGL